MSTGKYGVSGVCHCEHTCKTSSPRVVESVCRAYATSYNENPVVAEVSKEGSASMFLDCLTLQIARHWVLRQRQQHFTSRHDVHIP